MAVNVGQVVPSDLPKNRNFVLIGDDFGAGVITSGTYTDGWIDYFASILPGRVFYYTPKTDTAYSGSSAFTTTSSKNFIGQLNYVYNNKLSGTDPGTITDIIVLGGSYEVNGSTTDAIYNAITTFCTRSRQIFPNANISIGLVGVRGQYIVYGSNIYQAYKQGAARNGCAFLIDCLNIGTDPTIKSSDNHWTSDGYGRNNVYIAQMITDGTCEYSIRFNIPLGSLSEVTNPASFTFMLDCVMFPKKLVFNFYVTNGYNAGYVKMTSKPETYGSTRSKKFIQLASDDFNLVCLLGLSIFEGYYIYSRGDSYTNQFGGFCALRFLQESGHTYLTYQAAYPIEGSYKTNSNAYGLLTWNANGKDVESYYQI